MNTLLNKGNDTLETPLNRVFKKNTLCNERGFSAVELTIIIVILCSFFVAAGIFLKITSKSAYDITARHDLKAFADYQDFYFKLNNRCIGELGQSIRNDGVPSDLPIENYSVSEGVSITIISGSSDDPNNRDNPFTFQAKHEKSDTVFEYNFQNGKMTER